MTQDQTDEDKERLQRKRVVAGVSGGKDSAALSLWLTEQGIEHDRVFADTGWEHPLTYEYVRGPLTEALGPITEVKRPGGGMAALIRKKGMFPSSKARFCTVELKVLPILEHLHALDEDPVNTVGIRAQESSRRAGMPRWGFDESMDCHVWRPLIDWSEQDVISMHQRHALAPNPLYLRGTGVSRVGCHPCVFARKDEIAHMADLSPWRVTEIRELESELQSLYQERTEKDGKERAVPAFFYATDPRGKLQNIDDVVEWSRTSRGGRQLRLLDEAPAGCVKWGMCDHPEASNE